MEKQTYKVIGVMSGTSLDGIDLAEVDFTSGNNEWKFTLGNATTIPYPSEWFSVLNEAVKLSPEALGVLDRNYSLFLSKIIADFLYNNRIHTPDLIASHGHTVFHQPDKGYTLQIGNLPEIKKYLFHTPVICDFRVQDVTLGGQGAPLVPIGDSLLFSAYDFCLNLGGFSNCSFEKEGKRLAYDICPVNTVLNHYANKIGMPFDKNGKTASEGKINQDLFHQLNENHYYQGTYPKSLGIEFVLSDVFPVIDAYRLSVPDILHTYTHHIVYQLARNMGKEGAVIFVTGGGAFNSYLINQLQKALPKQKILLPEDAIINYKEALVFALLGVLKWRGEINVLASVTGAAADHSSGTVYR